MSDRGLRLLRDSANQLLDALVKATQQAHGDRPVTVADLRKVADGLKTSPELDRFYEKTFADLQGLTLSEAHDAQRVEMFHRLITHPLDKLLDSEEVSREALPNFFNSLRMMLGDEVDALQLRCAEIHDDLKAKHGDGFTWDMFYADPRAKLVLQQVLIRIAEAFKRFDVRRDWFIGLMQYSPANISIATNAYIANTHRDKSWIFGPENFRHMFEHLFASVRSMSDSDAAQFTKTFGKSPEEAFGALFRNLG